MINNKIVGILRRIVDSYDNKHNLKRKPVMECWSPKRRAERRIRKYSIPLDMPQCPVYEDNRCCGCCDYTATCNYSTNCGCDGINYGLLGGKENIKRKSRWEETKRLEKENQEKMLKIIQTATPFTLTNSERIELSNVGELSVERLVKSDEHDMYENMKKSDICFLIEDGRICNIYGDSYVEVSLGSMYDLRTVKHKIEEGEYLRYKELNEQGSFKAEEMPYEFSRMAFKVKEIKKEIKNEKKYYTISLKFTFQTEVTDHFIIS